MLKETTEHW